MKEITKLVSKYKRFGVKADILEQYSDGQEFIEYNKEDKDLDTITVPLPKTPSWNKIDGFGLPAKEQMFEVQVLPSKIRELQEEQDPKTGEFLTQDEIWTRLENEPEFYKKELDWIKLQLKRILGGYWFFNNGVATYIDGWHYRYLNFFELDIGLPEYRDRDRRFFHFARFCKDDKNCYGFVYPKHRREGATYKTSNIHYDIISTRIKARGGIQSMTDSSAEDVFLKHIVDPWRAMPFFLKPNHNGGDDPKKKLAFRASASRGKVGIKGRSTKSLSSEISYRASVETAFDGTKLFFYHHEEVGKAANVDVNKRWEVAQLTLSTGAGRNIHGFSIHTSTVGEMEEGGGEQFRELCEGSMYGKRNENGQTATGLYILFIPAWDGLEGFVDEYGMSVIDTPTPQQAEFLEKEVGAKQYVENTIEFLKTLPKKDKLLQFQREHPTTFRGCFRSNTKDPFFNIAKIEDRLDELREDRTKIVRGKFEWLGTPYESKVKFVPEENGRFEMSRQLPASEQNRVAWDGQQESFVPENIIYCAGGDPFKASKTKGKKKSNGGGAVFWGHDYILDPFSKPMEDWQSNRFVCTYTYRPDTIEEYGDDMIMMCIYWGCPMNPETNIEFLREYFDRMGYAGMLVYKYENGKFDSLAGIDTNEKIKQRIFQLYQSQIERHCHRECHETLLKEVAGIKDTSDMTNWDLFAAGGMAMLGITNYLPDIQKEQQNKEQASDNVQYFEEYTYK
jgi:hypothetical protein